MSRADRRTERELIYLSSGNVFVDLLLPNAEGKWTKTKLAVTINRNIADRNLSPTAAAETLKINVSKVSALANYRLEEFSIKDLKLIERLLHENVLNRKFSPKQQ